MEEKYCFFKEIIKLRLNLTEYSHLQASSSGIQLHRNQK